FALAMAFVCGRKSTGVDSRTVRRSRGAAAAASFTDHVWALSPSLAAVVPVVAAGVLGLTWLYPYDYHLWGGWAQGMGVVLVIGAWTAAWMWLKKPRPALAAVFGLLCAAIVLTHGIDLYSVAVGLVVLAAMNWRSLPGRRLARDGLLVIAV